MAAPRKNSTPRRPKAPAVQPLEDFEPIHLSSAVPVEKEGDRVVVFTLDDEEYTVPRKISQGVSLRLLRTARLKGELIAGQEMMELLLGEDAYEQLMDCPNVTEENLTQIIELLNRLVFGESEQPGK